MRDDANNLANALRGESKTQGDWGEQQMETILNAAGLEKNIVISGSSKLINGCNWSCKILAANAIASSGVITPFVSTSKINLS